MAQTVYQFFGGPLNGTTMTRQQIEAISCGHTENLSELRANDILCHRAELDDQPEVSSYLGPMWDGIRYHDKAARIRYDFELPEAERVGEPIHVLRYETQEVYNLLST